MLGKDQLDSYDFGGDTVMLSVMNDLHSFCYLVCGVLDPRKLLPGPKEAVVDLDQNICCLVGGFLLCRVLERGCN